MAFDFYFGAGLFNGADTFFNVHLAEFFEKREHTLFLPQRDGFEFGNLTAALEKIMPSTEVPLAVQAVILSLDLGIEVPKRKITLARLDEPSDPGVDIELDDASRLGKRTIGYRTDCRAPYGSLSDNFRGMHFFPGVKCDVLIYHPMTCKSVEQARQEIYGLGEKILIAASLPESDLRKRHYSGNLRGEFEELAQRLLGGIPDIHSAEGLRQIAERYKSNREFISHYIFPKFI